MRLLTIALFLISWTAQAAITEKYVSSLAGGGGDGSSGNPWTWAEMITDIVAGSKAGNRYNVKADGTYTRNTTTDTVGTAGGTTNAPVIIRGYKTTIGDGYQGRSNGNGDLVLTDMPTIVYTSGVLTLSGPFVIVESLNITSTKNGIAVNMTGTDIVVRGCKIANSTSGSSGSCLSNGSSRGVVENCDLVLSNGGNAGANAMTLSSSTTFAIGNRITSTAIGVGISSSGYMIGNTVYRCAGVAVTNTAVAASLFLAGNTVVTNALDGIGILPNSGSSSIIIINNCITDNGGWGINFGSTGDKAIVANNRTRDNVGGQYTNQGDWITATSWGEVTTDTGGPSQDYVDIDNNNFKLISTSPAVGMGIPLYMSAGALQPQATGGTTTTIIQSFPVFQ